MIALILISIVLIGFFTYRRYFPITGLQKINHIDLESNSFQIIDIRDYNDSYKSPIRGAMNLPVGYLNRYYSEIPKSDLVVVASNHLERNIGTRLLRRKGFSVVGYTIINDKQHIHDELLKKC